MARINPINVIKAQQDYAARLQRKIRKLEAENARLRDQNEELWLVHYKLLLDGADDTTAPDGREQ